MAVKFANTSLIIVESERLVMERQQHSFSDSTPRAPVGSDRLLKSAKTLLSGLQLMSISQIDTQKYGSAHFDPF